MSYENSLRMLYGGKFGGDAVDPAAAVTKSLEEYSKTLNSFSKEQLVDDLLDVLKTVGVTIPAGKTRAETVDAIMNQIPQYRKSGDSFNKDAETQKKICRGIAAAFNKKYSREVFDLNAPAPELCQSVSDLVSSLSSGMHTEFLTLYSDARERMKNIGIILTSLEKVRTELESNLKKTEDQVLAGKVQKYMEALQFCMQTLEQQMKSLQNMLNVDLSKEELDLNKFVTKYNSFTPDEVYHLEAGTEGFGRKLSKILQGIAVSSYTANITRDALKKVGMTEDKFKSIKTASALLMELNNLSSKISDDSALIDFAKNAQILIENFSRKYNIEKNLSEEKIEGSHMSKNFSGGDDDNSPVYGELYGELVNKGKSYEEIAYPTNMDKRIEAKKKILALRFYAFANEFGKSWEVLLASLDVLANKVGTSIPLTEQLDLFEKAVEQLSDSFILKKNLEKSLVGYYSDAMSRSKKEEFLGQLKVLRAHCEAIAEMAAYSSSRQYFDDVKSAINAMLGLVDKYSDEIKTQFGAGASVSGGDDGNSCGCGGGFEDLECTVSGAGEPLLKLPTPWMSGHVRKSPRTIGESLRKFSYNYKVAQMRSNVAHMSGEISHYAEKYEKKRAMSVAGRINELTDDVEKLLVGPSTPVAGRSIKDLLAAAPGEPQKKILRKTSELIRKNLEVKKKFLQTVESVDNMLTHFTSNLVKNLDTVDQIAKMIDEAAINTDWYDEKHGDSLAYVFDVLQSGKAGADAIKNSAGNHYYEKLASPTGRAVALNAGATTTQKSLDDFEAAQKELAKFVKGVQILKNIISVFVHIGGKINSVDINSSTYMSPVQIYNNLCEYLVWCMFDYNAVNVGGNTAELKGLNVDQEDNLFIMTIKAMCAKIFTVLGLQDVIRRPLESSKFSPIRVMIGGDASTPKIIESALELYLRLPLLAYFYRDLFAFYNDDLANDGELPTYRNMQYLANQNDPKLMKITMVPDVEGVFGDLVNLVFTKARNTNYRTLSESDMNEMVNIVNRIYEKMAPKHGDKVVSETIHEFVNEINRRFGVVLLEDVYKLAADKAPRYDYSGNSNIGEDYDTDVELLPGENELEMDRPTPSSSYLKGLSKDATSTPLRKSPFNLSAKHAKLVYLFRCKLDHLMSKLGDSGFTFAPLLSSTKNKLKTESDNESKYKLVTKMLRGCDSHAGIESTKIVMFHETVVVGLNLLAGIYTHLKQFSIMIHMMDLHFIKENAAALSGANFLDTLRQLLNQKSNLQCSANDLRLLSNVLNQAMRDNPIGAATTPAAILRAKIKVGFMPVFAEQLLCLGDDLQGLVTVKFDEKELTIDWTGLKSLVEQLFNSVSYFLEALRPHIESNLYERFTNKMNIGSYYWLQEQLMEKLINGRDPLLFLQQSQTAENARALTTGAPATNFADKYPNILGYDNLEKITNIANQTWKYMMAKYAFNAAGVPDPAGVATALPLSDGMKKLLWSKFGVDVGPNVIKTAKDNSPQPIEYLLLETDLEPKSYIKSENGARNSGGVYQFNDIIDNKNRSLWLVFNELLAKYLWRFYDGSSNKMYKNIIENIVSGVLNKQIFDKNASYDDTMSIGLGNIQNNAVPAVIVAPPMVSLVAGPDPSDQSLLLRSLATILRTINSVRANAQPKPYYLLDSIAEVSNYMKESYRANLPIFKNLFNELIKRADFCRKMLACNCFDVAEKQKMDNFCDMISKASMNVVQSCDLVLRELGDSNPRFMEVNHDSITDYKAQNNKLPFMPLSSSLRALARNDTQTIGYKDDEFLPFNGLGETEFKLEYGMRGLLNYAKPVTMENVPSYAEFVDLFNMTNESKFGLDKSRADAHLAAVVKALRYLTDIRHYKGYSSTSWDNAAGGDLDSALPNYVPLYPDVSLGSLTGTITPTDKQNWSMQALSTRNAAANLPNSNTVIALYGSGGTNIPLSTLIKFAESPMKDQQVADFVKLFGGGLVSSKVGAPERNILDLNIIPINIHALMREVPLVNIYNYSYTFDRMAVYTLFGLNDAYANALISEMCSSDGVTAKSAQFTSNEYDDNQGSGKGNFLQLIINPYNNTLQSKSIRTVALGVDTTELGRPKFLSDQLYNKVLLRSLNRGGIAYPNGPLMTSAGTSGNLSYISEPKMNITSKSLTNYGNNNNIVSAAQINVTSLNENALTATSNARFATKLTRNIVFLCCVQRLIRYKLYQNMYYQDNTMVVQRGSNITNPAHTEFFGNQVLHRKTVGRPERPLPDPAEDCDKITNLMDSISIKK